LDFHTQMQLYGPISAGNSENRSNSNALLRFRISRFSSLTVHQFLVLFGEKLPEVIRQSEDIPLEGDATVQLRIVDPPDTWASNVLAFIYSFIKIMINYATASEIYRDFSIKSRYIYYHQTKVTRLRTGTLTSSA
jgi:hypothetical protein